MAINPIQFQSGLSLFQYMKDFGTEAQCEQALFTARWPDGFRCPVCNEANAFEFNRKRTRYWECRSCHHQTSLKAGTLLQGSPLPLRLWFLAIYLITQSKTNLAALELKRQLGVSWKTAWLLKHKLMEAMFRREAEMPLKGEVVLDDAYLGGERTGGKSGRGSENKTAFVAAVEMHEGRPQRLRFDPVSGFTYEALADWATRALSPGCVVASDGLLGFTVLNQMGFTHHPQKALPGKVGCEVEPFKWLNVVLGNLKTALSGTHHAFKFAKYAHRYLAEVQYRFNRRVNLAVLPTRLLVAIAQTKPCPKRQIQLCTEGST